jgi:hypothetical protein
MQPGIRTTGLIGEALPLQPTMMFNARAFV